MKLNKIKAIFPAIALFLTASMTSCMDDLEKGNIDPTVEPNPNLLGLYSKCYAGLIMEGNDGNADFTIDDAGKSTLLRNVFNFNELSTDEAICWWSDGGITDIGYNQCMPGTATLRFLYYRLMSNITYCNHYLSLEAAQADKTMLAEVRFIRAYNYFLMLDFFGDPSFIETITSEVPKQAHAYNEKFDESATYTRAELLQLGREFLFNWVKKELENAEADMLPAEPETDSDANYGRADKAAAWPVLILIMTGRTILIGIKRWNMLKWLSIQITQSLMIPGFRQKLRREAIVRTICSLWVITDRMVPVVKPYFRFFRMER